MGTHYPRIGEIARELGVSATTVSRALSGKGRVSQETRSRVAACAERMGYAAFSSERPSTNNLALLIPSHFVRLDLPFLRKCMGGVCRMAVQREYDVLLCYADEWNTDQLRRQIAARKVDGVVLSRTIAGDPCLELVREYGVPYVALGRLEDPNALQVDNDQVDAARELTRLLLQMGIRRIAYLGNRHRYTVNVDRMLGFRQALEECDMTADEKLIFSNVESPEGCRDALEAALEQRPECLLCSDDSLAVSVLRELRQRGISVPGDVRLASLYDSEALLNTDPTVTAVQFDADLLGATACRMLLDAMAGREVPPRTVLGHQVILRASTK